MPVTDTAVIEPKTNRVRVAVTAPDPISREGVLSQMRRLPEVELCENSGPATVALLVEDTLDEAALARLRRTVRGEGARAVLVTGAVRDVMYGLTTRLHLRNRAHVVAYALREGYI
ncbi:hypothetical protein AB0H82_07515 [Streptomyces sp. NPDC050732]|uniref:hypothetical protein n=1 Tax=Streptomyces sp. NPDC050732 TaxID=3154632 RepID=UPI00341B3EA3